MQKNPRQLCDLRPAILAPLVVLLITVLLLPVQARALDDPAYICDQAAIAIAKETKVPLHMLRTMDRSETRNGVSGEMRPWPWTVTLQGKAVWFDTEFQAQVYVFRQFKQGARSFDVGCFQINYGRHGSAFSFIEDMFDPVLSARYAARYLTKLHEEHGDWPTAVAAYHAHTQKSANRYLQRLVGIRIALEPIFAAIRRVQPPSLSGEAQGGPKNTSSVMPVSDRSIGTLLYAERED